MKNILKVILFFSVCLILINCDSESNQEESSNKFQQYLEMSKVYTFSFFEKFENYLIRLHQYLQNDLGLEYPLDLILFTFMGIFIHYFLSLFSFKNSYVYNKPDQPDIVSLLNNKFKELGNIKKFTNVKNQPEKSLEVEGGNIESVKKINEAIQILNEEVESFKNEIKTNFVDLDEYLKVINNSQTDIGNSIKLLNENTPTPDGN